MKHLLPTSWSHRFGRTVRVLALACLPLAASAGRAQSPSPTKPVSNAAIVDLEHLRQVETCRAGLLDPEAREEERRRWADLLLGYDSTAAHDLVVELLRRNDRPRVQRALCDAIGDRSRLAPDRASDAFTPPLLELLGAGGDDLRAAAARTLADLPSAEVPGELGQLAADEKVPLPKRLAAVDALAPNTHRRDVVAQLIPLLTSGVPQIVERAVAALAPASRENFGADPQRWTAWWRERSGWREEDWLAEQLAIYRRRSRQLADEFAAYRVSTQQSLTAIEAQYRAFQQELFRSLPPEQRDARLAGWLDSRVSLTNRTALAIIKARIADEGTRPEGDVLAALLRLLRSATGDTQREALQIVQTLNAKIVVEAVLDLLDRERDPKARLAIFTAIGKLESPDATPALIREIADDNAAPECVREAAIALGTIAARVESDDPPAADAIEPLKRRYAALAANDTAMRAALLSAMAGIGSSAFTPELLAGVEFDDATVLQPALRGLLRLGEASKLARFRTLTAHADPQVRLTAVEAVAALGTEDADLENLLTRLNPAIESNASVREAGWRGFSEFMERRPVPERIRVADRLRDTPELELRYLTGLADSVTKSDASAVELTTILERVASTLVNQGKFAEAAVRWSQLFDAKTARGDADALDAGIRWLAAKLRAPATGELAQLLTRLRSAAGDDAEQARLRAAVQGYLESPEFAQDPAHARAVIGELRASPARKWSELLDHAEGTLASEPAAAAPTP